jgi:hypothetical protein
MLWGKGLKDRLRKLLQNSLRVIADSHFDSQLEESSSNGTSVAF